MQSVWEADNPDFRKRKRVARACEACQRRKKRCTHVFSQSNQPSSAIDDGDGDDDDDEASALSPLPDSSNTRTHSTRRWISDLVPESYLVAEKQSSRGGGRFSHVGILIEDDSHKRAYEHDAAQESSEHSPHKAPRSRHVAAQSQLKRYLEAVGALRTPPKATQTELINIYFTLIHPLLPVVDEKEFRQMYSDGTAPRLLINAICLVACKAETASPFLKVAENGQLLSPKRFAADLYHALVAAVNAGLESNRITKTRILALLFLHNEGITGFEDASLHLTYAIHCATTDALHMNFAGRKEINDNSAGLFWSLWTMDKINVCLAGRPLILHERDIGIDRPDCSTATKRSPFDIWCDLSTILEKVIGFYRPSSVVGVTGWEEDYPSFESIVGDYLEDGITESTFAILELYYQAITITACRADNNATASYARQALAALRIQALLTVEQVAEIPPLPILPWAASLALSVAYRHLRKAEIPSRVRTAVSNLRLCTEILERLSRTWWYSVPMARLGRKVLERYAEGSFPKSTPRAPNPRGTSTLHAPDNPSSQLNPQSSSLDILSTAAVTHGKARGSAGTSGETPRLGIQLPRDETAPLPVDLDESPSQGPPDNFFQDFDTLFGDYLDPSLPVNYLETGILGGDEYHDFENNW